MFNPVKKRTSSYYFIKKLSQINARGTIRTEIVSFLKIEKNIFNMGVVYHNNIILTSFISSRKIDTLKFFYKR